MSCIFVNFCQNHVNGIFEAKCSFYYFSENSVGVCLEIVRNFGMLQYLKSWICTEIFNSQGATSPEGPNYGFSKMQILSQLPSKQFNSASAFFRFFLEVSVKNCIFIPIASNPYFSLLLKKNPIWSKANCTQKYAKNRNLKLNTFSCLSI